MKVFIYLFAITFVYLIGIGLESLAIAFSGADVLYDFENYTAMQWIAHVVYNILILSVGILTGEHWSTEYKE